MIDIDVVKVFVPATLAFVVGIMLTPFVSDFLYKHKCWKKKAGKIAPDGRETPIFNKLHKDKEVGTPKMGGVIIWGAAVITILLLYVTSLLSSNETFSALDMMTGSKQAWLPVFTLVVGALIGLLDDYFEVSGRADYFAGGLSLKKRLLVVFLVSLVGAWWFYSKLDMTSILIPFVGELEVGWLFAPFFILVMLGVYSGGVIDGIDGLAGGVFMSAFASYGFIAYSVDMIDLAAFCFAVVGGLLAFLWFNIPPARFYMAETGTMALTTSLTVVAFLTQHVLLLPIIAFPLVATTLSDIIQLSSKRFRNGKKVFLVAPVHHHFEAIGWPSYKVTMRYWIISFVFAIVGLIIALIG